MTTMSPAAIALRKQAIAENPDLFARLAADERTIRFINALFESAANNFGLAK